MGVYETEPSLWRMARQYLKEKYHKPGNVYLGVVSRLDADVSGAVVFARTSKAAARLNEQFREREVSKVYWAIVEKMPDEPVGRLEDWIRKNDRRQRMEVVRPGEVGAQHAALSYRVRRSTPCGALLEVQLETGRKHQIRVQLARHLSPILGDQKYGARRQIRRGIALHARQLTLLHPVRKEPVSVTAPLPAGWRAWLGKS